MCLGQVVFSKNGRNKGNIFIIYKIQGEYAFLVDGNTRPLLKPKKKKQKHIQVTNIIIESIKEKFELNSYIQDAEIRKVLLAYNVH